MELNIIKLSVSQLLFEGWHNHILIFERYSPGTEQTKTLFYVLVGVEQ